jgi:protein-L-isoaspartate(D-aspartate) O-methyltransferase
MKDNKELVEYLIQRGRLRSKRIIEAFYKVDRADFVVPEYLDEAYEDYPLSIGYGQTISQPTTVAFMLELLQPEVGDKVLDVGAGSGWTTTILSHIVGKKGKVFGVELVPQLAKFGSNNILRHKDREGSVPDENSSFVDLIPVKADPVGLPEEAPYDKILVSASANHLPMALTNQLKVGGIMVLPIKSSVWKIEKQSDSQTVGSEYPGFSFVPLKSN